jgi:hypothetical protein
MFFITVNTLMRYTVCTTFNAAGYEKYGHRMIQTFLQTWPAEVQLVVYAENCTVTESAPNLQVLDLADSSPELVAFKNQWKDVPKANGDISAITGLNQRKDFKKQFKWNAVRFSHKVYAIFHAAKTTTADWLIWMDADMVCHSPVSESDIDRLIPAHTDLCYLGRQGKFSECGLYAMKLHTPAMDRFLSEFQRVYDQAETGIFKLAEWHDSFVFDSVRVRVPELVQHNWSEALIDLRATKTTSVGEGHPLINTEWGEYLDHLKGSRKDIGRSERADLKMPRRSSYWKNT